MRHKQQTRSFWSVLAILVAVLMVATGAYIIVSGQSTPDIDASISASPTTEATTAPRPSPNQVTTTAEPVYPEGCESQTTAVFVPATVTISGAGTKKVSALPRKTVVQNGEQVVVAPDPQAFDPNVYAWDRDSSKINASGSSIFTAHTYSRKLTPPALGNQLVGELKDGDVFKVSGKETAVYRCFRVTDRQEFSVKKYPLLRVYEGSSDRYELNITVCSGYKDGVWTKRTVWFAEPIL